jgi:O-antigen/teichoic acid export membrane protein
MRIATLFLPVCLVTGIMRAEAAGRHRWGLIAAERLAAAVTRLGLTVGLAISGGLTPAVAALIVTFSSGAGLLLYVGCAIRDRRTNKMTDADPFEPAASVRELLVYGGLIWVGTSSGAVAQRVDQVLFPSLSSLSELAFYAVAFNIGELASVIVFAVRDVAFATEAGEPDATRIAALARVAFVASLTTCLLLICSQPLWIGLVFGSEYVESIWPATVLLVGIAFSAPGSIAGAALNARGRPGVRSAILVAAMIVNLIALVILVPMLGALGAAVASLITNFVASGIAVGLLSRQVRCRATDFYGVKLADLALARRIAMSIQDRLTNG